MASLKIVLETDDIILEIPKRQIDSISSLSEIVNNPDIVNYGTMPSSGSISIIDYNEELYKLIKNQKVTANETSGKIFLNNKVIRSFIIKDIDYSLKDKTVTLLITDIVDFFDSKNINKIRLSNEKNLLTVFNSIVENSVVSQDSLSTKIISSNNNTYQTISDYLTSIVIPNPFVNESTIRQSLDKVCTLAQLNVFSDSEGQIKFVSARPVFKKDETQNIVVVNPRNIIEEPFENIVLKNRFVDIKREYNKTEETRQNITVQKNIHVLKDAFMMQ